MKKILALGAILAALLFPQAAIANTLVSTSPVAGEAIETAPSAVTITTDSTLLTDGNDIRVTDPNGARVDLGVTVADNVVVVDLKPLTTAGVYMVSYSLLAEDNTPLTGNFTFNYVAPTISESVAPQPTPSKTSVPSGNNFGTSLFVIGLLIAALVVTVALASYARKLYKER
jgi:methionine-rich copper-binding protein CopC